MPKIIDFRIKNIIIGIESVRLKITNTSDKKIRKKTRLNLTQVLIIQASIFGNCVSQAEISKMLQLSQPAVSKQLKILIESKMVIEEPLDRRSWQISLTKLGEKEFQTAFKIYDQECNNFLKKLSNEEINSLNKLINKLNS